MEPFKPLSTIWDDMHFVWFSMEMGFLTTSLWIPSESLAMRLGFRDEWWEIHLVWKTIQHAFPRILYISRHFNHTKYTAQSWRSWKSCEMDLTHNCSLRGGKSEVCDKYNILKLQSCDLMWLIALSSNVRHITVPVSHSTSITQYQYHTVPVRHSTGITQYWYHTVPVRHSTGITQ